MVTFYWILSDSNSPRVSRGIFSILTDFSNAVFWMVSIIPLISCFSSCLSKPLGTFPSAPTTIDIKVTFIFDDCFFCFLFVYFLVLRPVPRIFFAFFYFLYVICRNGKIHKIRSSFFFLVNQYYVWSSGRD